jgi:hypothetical protein
MKPIATVTPIAILYLLMAAVTLPGEQLIEPIPVPGVPVSELDGAVGEWLPGIWGLQVYEFDGNAFVRASGHDSTYRFLIDEDGSLEVSRWRGILPSVEVGFYDGTYSVLAESWEGESREFGLDLNSMTITFGQPMFNGVVRVENDESADTRFYRGVWRKLPNDFYQGPL